MTPTQRAQWRTESREQERGEIISRLLQRKLRVQPQIRLNDFPINVARSADQVTSSKPCDWSGWALERRGPPKDEPGQSARLRWHWWLVRAGRGASESPTTFVDLSGWMEQVRQRKESVAETARTLALKAEGSGSKTA